MFETNRQWSTLWRITTRIMACAWVLWGGPGTRLIMPIDGYESKAECKVAEATYAQRDQTQGRKSSYQCLPTGTDPRERN